MSKIICTSAIDGAVGWVAQAEEKLNQALEKKCTVAKTREMATGDDSSKPKNLSPLHSLSSPSPCG